MTADFHISIERHKYRYNMYIYVFIYIYICIYYYNQCVFSYTLDKLSAWPTVPMEAFAVILQWHIACIS